MTVQVSLADIDIAFTLHHLRCNMSNPAHCIACVVKVTEIEEMFGPKRPSSHARNLFP